MFVFDVCKFSLNFLRIVKKLGICFKCGFCGYWVKNCINIINDKEIGYKLGILDSIV